MEYRERAKAVVERISVECEHPLNLVHVCYFCLLEAVADAIRDACQEILYDG